MAVEQSNNNNENSDSSHFYGHILIASASKKHFRCVNLKLSKNADFSSECCSNLKLKLLFVQFVLNRLANEHVLQTCATFS